MDVKIILRIRLQPEVSRHIPSVFSMSAISFFRSIENKHDLYRAKDCMKNFLWVFKRPRNENNYFWKEKNEVPNKKAAGILSVILAKKNLKINIWKIKKYRKVRDHYKYSVPKNNPIVFHCGSNYNFHFIIKESAEEYKNEEEITKSISYILQFTDSARFMVNSLSNVANDLSEGLHRIKCISEHDDKTCETCGIKHKYCDCF